MRLFRYIAAAIAVFAAPVANAQDASFLFALVDVNHDNQIQRQEVQAYAVMQWRNLDPDDTGALTRTVLMANPRDRMVVGDLMPAADATLSRAAFIEGLIARFGHVDADRNGILDTAEFRAFMGIPSRAIAGTQSPPMLPSLASRYPQGLPRCEDIAMDQKAGLIDRPGVTDAKARIVPANAVDAAYCQVQFVYNSGKSGRKDGYAEGQSQAITIRVGLPLRPDEGGKVAWNGRIQNVGSGGCMGLVPAVTVATNAGFASASSDGGHGAPWIAFNCGFGVIQGEHRLNEGLIRDFSAEHVRWQTYWSKALVAAYYGQPAKRTYWCGCSQGGREGFIALQTIPDEYDGILAGGAALYWMRFQMAQAWSGLVIKDMLRSKEKDLTPAEIAQTVALEVEACDSLDGIEDGVLADPRRCTWSAKAAICGVATAKAGACLDADQAEAFDMIRRGPHNHLGQQIWFPWEPGTTFSNQTDYLLSDSVMQWALRDLTFKSQAHLYMDQAAIERARDPKGITYEDMATLASQSTSDIVDMSDPAIDAARRSGVKVLAWTGTADRNIQSRNTIKYYRDVAAHFGVAVSDEDLQDWFRVFLYPGVDHCAGGVGAQPGNLYEGPLFQTLVRWVERDLAPERIIAVKTAEDGAVIRTRPACAYPETAIYSGDGSTDKAANFICGGNLETPEVIAAAQLAPHKKENGTGAIPKIYTNSGKQ